MATEKRNRTGTAKLARRMLTQMIVALVLAAEISSKLLAA